jgi:hypothetical protein
MKQAEKDKSSKKENKKVQTNKQFDDNKVTEGTDTSVNTQNDGKAPYPPTSRADKEYKIQSEFIDRNSDSKDKS